VISRARIVDLALMLGAFAAASVIAVIFGASLGHAITFGQLAFAAALGWVLLKR
jgi:hypothetical protein